MDTRKDEDIEGRKILEYKVLETVVCPSYPQIPRTLMEKAGTLGKEMGRRLTLTQNPVQASAWPLLGSFLLPPWHCSPLACSRIFTRPSFLCHWFYWRFGDNGRRFRHRPCISVPQAHLLSHRGESQTSWPVFSAQASCQGTGPHSWVPSSPSTIPSLPPHKFWEKLGISLFCFQLLTQTLLGFNFHNQKDSHYFFSNREALLRSYHLWPHTHTGWHKLQNAQGREEGVWYHLPDPVVGIWLKPWVSEGTGGAERTSDGSGGWGIFFKYLALQF